MAEIIKLSEENIRYRCSFNQSREGVEMICKDRSYKCFDPKFTKDCKVAWMDFSSLRAGTMALKKGKVSSFLLFCSGSGENSTNSQKMERNKSKK